VVSVEQLQEGDVIKWNDRRETATVTQSGTLGSETAKRKDEWAVVETARGTHYRLANSNTFGRQYWKIGGGQKKPLRSIELVE